MKYRKKPVAIEAVEVKIENLSEIISIAEGFDIEIKIAAPGELKDIILRGEFNSIAPVVGSVLIKYNGNITQMTADNFKEIYEPAE